MATAKELRNVSRDWLSLNRTLPLFQALRNRAAPEKDSVRSIKEKLISEY